MRAAVVAMVSTIMLAGLAIAQPVAISPADGQEKDSVARLLASPLDGDRAWGAYLAANYQQRGFVPQVVQLLKSPDARVRLAALDALIRLQADPDEKALTALLDAHLEHLDSVLILVARRIVEHREFLMKLLDRELKDGQSLQVNSLLLRSAHPEYAARLLRDWEIRIRDRFTTDAGLVEMRLAPAYAVCADGASGYWPDFPPLRFYFVETIPQRSLNLFFPAPFALGYRVSDNPSRCEGSVDREEMRLALLLELAMGKLIDHGIISRSLYTLAGSPRSLEEYKSGIEGFVVRLKAALVDKGLLGRGEAASPRIVVE